MFRTLLLVLLGICMLQNVRAQDSAKSDTLKYYFDANNIETSKDSADHSLMILPKSEKNGGLYPVFEYYRNGKIKLSTFLTTQSFTNNFEGLATTYYPNGVKQRVAKYHDGFIVGETTEFFKNGNKSRESIFKKTKTGQEESIVADFFPTGKVSKILNFETGKSIQYFPNGNIYLTRKLSSNSEMDFLDCLDSTGVVLAKNGTGKLIFYTEDFKAALREINLKHGIKDGQWQPIVDSAATLRFDKTGPIETNPAIPPLFGKNTVSSFWDFRKSVIIVGRPSNFAQFVFQNFNYPKQEQKNKASGEVNLTMVVETDGALTHIKINQATSKAFAEEAIRVVGLSAPWTPGTLINGEFIRSSVAIKFLIDPSTNSNNSYPDIGVVIDKNYGDVALSDSAYNKTDSAFLAGNVEKLPEYAGGMAGINKTVDANIQYPLKDRMQNRTGKVYIQFIIEKDGHMSNIHAISGPSATLKAEGERVVRLLTAWQPGLMNNKSVRVIYTLPISFSLKVLANASQRIEKMPEFPGGIDAFMDFYSEILNIR